MMTLETYPTLKDDFITLRKYEENDLGVMKALLNDKITMKALFCFFERETWTDEQVKERYDKFHKEYLEGKDINWLIELNSNQKVVGNCGFKNIDRDKNEAEYGVILHKDYWAQNLAQNSAILALKYGFEEMNLNRIYFETTDDNVRAKGIMNKAGIPFCRKTDNGYVQFEFFKKSWVELLSS